MRMYVNMHAYVFSVYIYVCTCVNMHTYVFFYTYVNMRAYVFSVNKTCAYYTYVNMHVYVFSVFVYLYTYVNMRILCVFSVCICIYICKHPYIRSFCKHILYIYMVQVFIFKIKLVSFCIT